MDNVLSIIAIDLTITIQDLHFVDETLVTSEKLLRQKDILARDPDPVLTRASLPGNPEGPPGTLH